MARAIKAINISQKANKYTMASLPAICSKGQLKNKAPIIKIKIKISGFLNLLLSHLSYAHNLVFSLKPHELNALSISAQNMDILGFHSY